MWDSQLSFKTESEFLALTITKKSMQIWPKCILMAQKREGKITQKGSLFKNVMMGRRGESDSWFLNTLGAGNAAEINQSWTTQLYFFPITACCFVLFFFPPIASKSHWGIFNPVVYIQNGNYQCCSWLEKAKIRDLPHFLGRLSIPDPPWLCVSPVNSLKRHKTKKALMRLIGYKRQ